MYAFDSDCFLYFIDFMCLYENSDILYRNILIFCILYLNLKELPTQLSKFEHREMYNSIVNNEHIKKC